jgi:hypothetical protein
MSDMTNKFNAIYELNKNNFNMNFFDYSSLFHVVLFTLVMFIIYWYIRVQVSQDKFDWENRKCDPIYMYFSGYLNPETDQSGYETTLNIYNDCVTRGYKNAIGMIGDEQNIQLNSHGSLLMKERDVYNDLFDNYQEKQDISKEMINDLSLNLTKDSTIAYNYLLHLGTYVDQLNKMMDYVSNYARNYLTYLYMFHLKNNNTIKMNNVGTLLNKYFDGPTFSLGSSNTSQQ